MEDIFFSPVFRTVLRLLQRGEADEAKRELSALAQDEQLAEEVALLAAVIDRSIRTRDAAAIPTLIWQYDNHEAWEGQYITDLLSPLIGAQVFDWRQYKTFSEKMIVVDNQIGSRTYDYVRAATRQGCEVTLLHLGDEGYLDDCASYRWCRAVFRNYWSRLQPVAGHVHFLPLGFKAGVRTSQPVVSSMERQYLWSFCGDLNKSTRQQMKSAMMTIKPHYLHGTSGFGSTDALPVTDYRSILDRSVFVPCPPGFCNADSFRIYEALEAGCIPIIETSGDYDYFKHTFGRHPFVSVTSWSDAPRLIRELISSNGLQDTSDACQAWWRLQQARVRQQIAAACL